jgi:hypothetical protein
MEVRRRARMCGTSWMLIGVAAAATAVATPAHADPQSDYLDILAGAGIPPLRPGGWHWVMGFSHQPNPRRSTFDA